MCPKGCAETTPGISEPHSVQNMETRVGGLGAVGGATGYIYKRLPSELNIDSPARQPANTSAAPA